MDADSVTPRTTLETHLRAQDASTMRLFWHRLRWHLVSTMLPAKGAFDLADVGAGAGFAGEYLSRDFPEARYFFVEPLASLEHALAARFGAGRNLRGAERFIGVRYVLLLDVLEHQELDRAFMREIVDRMEPGAQLIITVPALPSLWSEWDTLLGHFRRYTRRTLAAAVEGCPVRICDLSYLFPELVPIGLVRRLLPDRSAGKASGEFPHLPAPINELLYVIGRASLPSRRIAPFGTSMCMRIEKS